MSSIVIYTVSIVLIFVITMSPLLKDNHYTHIQDIIPTRLSIKRKLNPLQRKMNENSHKLMVLDRISKVKKVYTYIATSGMTFLPSTVHGDHDAS